MINQVALTEVVTNFMLLLKGLEMYIPASAIAYSVEFGFTKGDRYDTTAGALALYIPHQHQIYQQEDMYADDLVDIELSNMSAERAAFILLRRCFGLFDESEDKIYYQEIDSNGDRVVSLTKIRAIGE